MKKSLFVLLILTVFILLPVAANGNKESQDYEKVIRVADQIPGLITPGVWDGQAISLNSSIYEYLVEVDAIDGTLDPVLAVDWNTIDGSRWIFHLRKGVTFHDGSACTAKDVKFTIERTQDPAIGHLKRKDFAVVDTIEIIDDYTIAINLKERRPTFIYQMTDYNMAILADDYDYNKFGETHPMGTGPFKLQRLDPKESALLVRNPDYWNPELPKVDKLALYFLADTEAKVSMLESGLIDIVPHISPAIKRRLDKEEGFIVFSPYQEQRFIAMAVDQKPFSDNRVRLAFKYSLDQEILARSVAMTTLYNGFFYNEVPIMNMMAEYKDIPLRTRDITKAKELLRDAGYPNGVSIDLYYSSDHPFEKELAQSVKELAAPAGFKINLKGFTRDVYLSQYWLKVPFSITGWGGRIDPSMLLALAFKTGAPWNESHLGDPYIDALIEKISLEADFETRVGLYHELQDWFHENGPLVNVQVPKLVALSDKIVDYRLPMTMLPQLKYTDKIE